MSFVAGVCAWVTFSFSVFVVIAWSRAMGRLVRKRKQAHAASLEVEVHRLSESINHLAVLHAEYVVIAELDMVVDEIRNGSAPREWARLILDD